MQTAYIYDRRVVQPSSPAENSPRADSDARGLDDDDREVKLLPDE